MSIASNASRTVGKYPFLTSTRPMCERLMERLAPAIVSTSVSLIS